MKRRIFLGIPAVSLAMAAEPPLVPDSDTAGKRLAGSPRHGEWLTITEGRSDVGRWSDSVRAWIGYPARATRAPVVIVIHEISGVTDWIRAVADQLAAEGFLAIAPDLKSGHGVTAEPRIEDVARRLTSVARYADSLPAASGKFASVGFSWGGAQSFAFAGNEPRLAAAVVCYGASPDRKTIGRIQCPVLGLYGGADARVNTTIGEAEAEMQRLGRSFEKHVYAGAGPAFLRLQSEGANREAARQSWPIAISFLKRHLEKR